ncbi:hypothetical protein EVAR_60065_1 [Eumeta japonica]|uniref:Uncharacterized protein n=1 Tax=Eumeta variegata TaxID=151549 RepID=A0A4C1ZLH1_EUMVA|nr:hypothetical protein EVAR_60065_1 [Eumeta japonica]
MVMLVLALVVSSPAFDPLSVYFFLDRYTQFVRCSGSHPRLSLDLYQSKDQVFTSRGIHSMSILKSSNVSYRCLSESCVTVFQQSAVIYFDLHINHITQFYNPGLDLVASSNHRTF